MGVQIILVASYLAGAFLSFSMLRIEHEAEGKPYTKLDRVLSYFFSLFSLVMVLALLVSSWFKKIAATGYWNRPVENRSK